MSKSIQAVIFDMDGVIVDSETRHEKAFYDVVKEIGYEHRHDFKFADYVGRSDHDLWADFVARYQPPQSFDELMALKRKKVIEVLRADRPLFPGLYELVEGLAARYKLALASGSERPIVDEVLALRDLKRFFPVTVSGSDIQHGKPRPDIFLKAARLLGIPPERCAVIEDSRPGIAAGLAAGMTVYAIANTHPPEELTHAHFVVNTYAEVASRLLPPG